MLKTYVITGKQVSLTRCMSQQRSSSVIFIRLHYIFIDFIRFENGEIKKTFFATECCPKPAEHRIFNVLSSVSKQKVHLGGTMLASVLKMSHQ